MRGEGKALSLLSVLSLALMSFARPNSRNDEATSLRTGFAGDTALSVTPDLRMQDLQNGRLERFQRREEDGGEAVYDIQDKAQMREPDTSGGRRRLHQHGPQGGWQQPYHEAFRHPPMHRKPSSATTKNQPHRLWTPADAPPLIHGLHELAASTGSFLTSWASAKLHQLQELLSSTPPHFSSCLDWSLAASMVGEPLAWMPHCEDLREKEQPQARSASTEGITGAAQQEAVRRKGPSEKHSFQTRKLLQPPDLPDPEEVMEDAPDNVNVPGWYRRTTDPDTGDTQISVGPGGIFGSFSREGNRQGDSGDSSRRRLQQPPDLPDPEEVLRNAPANVNVPGWYSRTTDPETGETKIRVGNRFFPIVSLTRDDSNLVNGEGGEGKEENKSQRGGSLESLSVGPFGSVVNLDESGVDILGGWGRR